LWPPQLFLGLGDPCLWPAGDSGGDARLPGHAVAAASAKHRNDPDGAPATRHDIATTPRTPPTIPEIFLGAPAKTGFLRVWRLASEAGEAPGVPGGSFRLGDGAGSAWAGTSQKDIRDGLPARLQSREMSAVADA
jgi:hypothetical protein